MIIAERSCLPLIVCHFLVSIGMGRVPASGNLESDCPWYAVDADGCRKVIFYPVRQLGTTTDTNAVKGGGPRLTTSQGKAIKN